MPDLRTRAAAAAAPDGATDAPASRDPNFAPDTGAPAGLEPIDAPEGIDPDAADVPVHTAVTRMMRDLGKIAKSERYDAAGTKFNFRGVDRVVNAVAPLQRKHGVLIIPEVRSTEYRDVPSRSGGRSHECVVTVAWHWIGPRGDVLTPTPVTVGEALDSADKASSKAQSVAWRTCLIEMLSIPTGDPDPDSQRIERGDQPAVSATAYRDEIVDPRTSLGRLKQIRAELGQHGLRAVLVVDDTGEDVALGDLVDRIGRERSNAR